MLSVYPGTSTPLSVTGQGDITRLFTRFRAHGHITKDGAKMSKSHGNVINPDDYIERYGADTLRMYLMFLGPLDHGGDFTDQGIGGIRRFLNRVWTVVNKHAKHLRRDKPESQYQRHLHGRMRTTIKLPIDAEQEDAISVAIQEPIVQRYVGDFGIKRVIYVPNRIVNFVI